jgi:hypothetical protein
MHVSVIKPESSVSGIVRVSVIQSKLMSQVCIIRVMGLRDPSQSVGPQNTSLPSVPEAELITRAHVCDVAFRGTSACWGHAVPDDNLMPSGTAWEYSAIVPACFCRYWKDGSLPRSRDPSSEMVTGEYKQYTVTVHLPICDHIRSLDIHPPPLDLAMLGRPCLAFARPAKAVLAAARHYEPLLLPLLQHSYPCSKLKR